MRFEPKAWRAEVLPLAVLILLITAARSTLADHYHVPSGSMEFTLLPGDHVVVDKTAYGLRLPYTKIDLIRRAAPVRGEVVVLDSPRDGRRLIKRVAAVAGDTVELRDGRLIVNGVRLQSDAPWPAENFGDHVALLNLADGGGPRIPRLTIPAGMVLLLGDHRGDSLDSRYFGLVAERELMGRALAVFWRRGTGPTWRAL